MASYLLTSSQFTGSVTLRYNAEGAFEGVEVNATLTEAQRAWLLQKTPANEADLCRVLGNSTTAKLTKIEVTFALFWDKYNDKVHSSRKRTLAKWDRMPKAEQVKAYNYVGFYLSTLRKWQERKNAETYLNAELWNN